jgi:hypothetical protein
MVDYFPALANTVSRLANNDAEARKDLYEHARSNIVLQLHRRNPQISEKEIVRERAALEEAISKVEAEANRRSTLNEEAKGPQAATDIRELKSAEARKANKDIDMRTMPEWLAAMLVGIALVTGMMATGGLLYLALS